MRSTRCIQTLILRCLEQKVTCFFVFPKLMTASCYLLWGFVTCILIYLSITGATDVVWILTTSHNIPPLEKQVKRKQLATSETTQSQAIIQPKLPWLTQIKWVLLTNKKAQVIIYIKLRIHFARMISPWIFLLLVKVQELPGTTTHHRHLFENTGCFWCHRMTSCQNNWLRIS